MKISVKKCKRLRGGMGISATLGLYFMLGSCAISGDRLPTPEQLIGSGVILAKADEKALKRGRRAAITVCAECHRIYWPEEYSPAEWPRIIGDMGTRAGLSRERIRDIEAYFVAASRWASTSR